MSPVLKKALGALLLVVTVTVATCKSLVKAEPTHIESHHRANQFAHLQWTE